MGDNAGQPRRHACGLTRNQCSKVKRVASDQRRRHHCVLRRDRQLFGSALERQYMQCADGGLAALGRFLSRGHFAIGPAVGAPLEAVPLLTY